MDDKTNNNKVSTKSGRGDEWESERDTTSDPEVTELASSRRGTFEYERQIPCRSFVPLLNLKQFISPPPINNTQGGLLLSIYKSILNL